MWEVRNYWRIDEEMKIYIDILIDKKNEKKKTEGREIGGIHVRGKQKGSRFVVRRIEEREWDRTRLATRVEEKTRKRERGERGMEFMGLQTKKRKPINICLSLLFLFPPWEKEIILEK